MSSQPAISDAGDDLGPELREYPEEYLLCRLQGCDWPDPSTWHWTRRVTRRGRVISLQHTMRCPRCGKWVRDTMDPVTGAQTRYPDYPEGYLRKGGRIPRGAVRIEMVRRLTTTNRPGSVEDEIVYED